MSLLVSLVCESSVSLVCGSSVSLLARTSNVALTSRDAATSTGSPNSCANSCTTLCRCSCVCTKRKESVVVGTSQVLLLECKQNFMQTFGYGDVCQRFLKHTQSTHSILLTSKVEPTLVMLACVMRVELRSVKVTHSSGCKYSVLLNVSSIRSRTEGLWASSRGSLAVSSRTHAAPIKSDE